MRSLLKLRSFQLDHASLALLHPVGRMSRFNSTDREYSAVMGVFFSIMPTRSWALARSLRRTRPILRPQSRCPHYRSLLGRPSPSSLVFSPCLVLGTLSTRE